MSDSDGVDNMLSDGSAHERQPRFTHLTPALRELSDDALNIWGDATERSQAFRVVIERWQAGDYTGTRDAVARVDDAVRMGLHQLGFAVPQLTHEYTLREGQLPWLARVEGASVVLAGDLLADLLRSPTGADRAFRTLVHETIHLRQPRSAHALAERHYRGYEEGLAGGLARLIVHQWAAIPSQSGSFDYPVAVYRVFAAIIGVKEEDLYRAVWEHAPGDVRGAFAETIARLYTGQYGNTLILTRRETLAAFADQQFGTARLAQRPNARVIRTLMRKMFS